MATGDIATVITGLQRTPLLTIPEMRAALDGDRTAHGIYAWWLINSEALRGVPSTPHPSEPVGLLYLGIGSSTIASKRTLRKRFGDHTRGDTGRSTLRRTLASFLFDQESWSPYWTDRPLLIEPDNNALTEWQTTNLRVQWVRLNEPWTIEANVIHLMHPPLNRSHNQAHPFYSRVGEARKHFREAAEKDRR